MQKVTCNSEKGRRAPHLFLSRPIRFSTLFLLSLCLCCNSPSKEGQAPYTAHVAFAGGGWRAHTGHSAWIMSLLNNGTDNLGNVFRNVNTISSNSGGSWFNTMLAFSGQFVSDISAPNAINTWASTGWLGRQQALFDAAPSYCQDLSGDLFLACVAKHYTSPFYWDSVVANIAFRNYPLGSTALNGTRQPWAANKSLLLASTLLTNSVVITAGDFDYNKYYYQACPSPGIPVLNGDKVASCSNGAIPDVIPVTFSSLPNGSGLTFPFLRPFNTSFNLGYTKNGSRAPQAPASIQNPINTNQVPVILAAAASSAAAGFEASFNVSGSWTDSFAGEDEALSVSLANSTLNFVDASDMDDVNTLANNAVVRLADGGAVDNSGVAQLVSFLQQNNQANNFNIVAFDNVQKAFPVNSNTIAGIDIANLFGAGVCQGNQVCSNLDCTGTCVHVPGLQIFDPRAFINTPVTWKIFADPQSQQYGLIYTRYNVTTVDNAIMGVSKGATGTLHAFTCVWQNANTAPENKTKDGDFIAYGQMLQFINKGLMANGAQGLKYLKTALGIP